MENSVLLIGLLVSIGIPLSLLWVKSRQGNGSVFAPADRVMSAGRQSTHTAQQHLESQLLTKLRGDREAMERLLKYEQKRFPSEDRARLLQRAINRWLDDNR